MTERLTVGRWAFALAMLIAIGGAPLVLGEDLSADEEAKIMAQEDESEAALSLDKKPPGSFSGRILLQGDAVAAADAVVGMLTVKDRAYQLRIARPEVLAQLQPFNGKTATVCGKIRMRGKYFIADGVQLPTPGAERSDRGRRSGM